MDKVTIIYLLNDNDIHAHCSFKIVTFLQTKKESSAFTYVEHIVVGSVEPKKQSFWFYSCKVGLVSLLIACNLLQ